MFEIDETIVRGEVPGSTHDAVSKPNLSGAGVSNGVAVSSASECEQRASGASKPSWPAAPYLTNEMWRNIELSRVARMNCWVKFAGLVLIAAVLVIVIAPDLDLPPTARFSSVRDRVHLAAFNASLPVSIISLRPNCLGSAARVRLPGFNSFSTNLIDLNCTRLC